MRLCLMKLLVCSFWSFSQDFPLTYTEIEGAVKKIKQTCVLSDSLTFIDSNCTYLKAESPFTGYVIHFYEDQTKFHAFDRGFFAGEEWVFNLPEEHWHPDSLLNRLHKISIRSDTNEFYMIVSTYYDFKGRKVREVFIERRYKCAPRERRELTSFTPIFGSDFPRDLAYKSFYENGNPKEIYIDLKGIKWEYSTYYENGQLEAISGQGKDRDDGYKKRFDEDGKCIDRLIVKNGMYRGGYVVSDGKKSLAFIERYKDKKTTRKRKANKKRLKEK